MSAVENLHSDAAECIRLSQITSRPAVQTVLLKAAENFNQQAKVEEEKASIKVQRGAANEIFTVKIINYGWDQSDRFIKLYVTLKDVQTLTQENVITTFHPKGLELIVTGLNGRNHSLVIKNLLHPIKPEDSHHKVKTDMVVIFLKKRESENWSCVTESEVKSKEFKAPKLEENGDPSQSLMTLMKQMYEDGDDDMKRNIAKAWTEARDKKMDL